jgi:hypothetical protein
MHATFFSLPGYLLPGAGSFPCSGEDTAVVSGEVGIVLWGTLRPDMKVFVRQQAIGTASVLVWIQGPGSHPLYMPTTLLRARCNGLSDAQHATKVLSWPLIFFRARHCSCRENHAHVEEHNEVTTEQGSITTQHAKLAWFLFKKYLLNHTFHP